MTLTSGSRAAIAAAMPEINPPPDTGTSTTLRPPGSIAESAAISSPTVPCPEITLRSSKGAIMALPVSAASSAGRLNRCSTGTSSTVAPMALVASTLRGGACLGDDDVGVHSEHPCRVCHCLRVISGRVGKHAASPDVRCQSGHRGDRTADLERADRLQPFRFQPQPRPGRGQQRSSNRNAGDSRRRILDLFQRDQLLRRDDLHQRRRMSVKVLRSTADCGGPAGASSRRSSGSIAASTPSANNGEPATSERFTIANAIGPSS